MPEVGQVESFINIIDRSGFFETVEISNEDLKKTEMYAANAKREQAKLSFTDYGEYLDSLKMTGIVKPFEPMYMERIAQLTNKSNQFNLTTLRCSVEDVTGMANDGQYITLAGRLNDKFGENGLVAVSAGKIDGDGLDIILWLMSCRVLKRGLENAMMNELVAQCQRKDIKRIIGHYYPTAKNAMVKNFYAEMGFKKINENSVGNTEWALNVDEFKPFDVHMAIER
ncbi:MAG: hypothetical protein LUI14_00980 [Lachnospiraceae bacterium]|nr:hypothetical protein [Lachnospiraceae bacterium]